MSYLEIAKKFLEERRAKEGFIIDPHLAVKICSHVLEDDIWVILDRSFTPPPDGLAHYYAEEIPLLKDKTADELRTIHQAKLEFPGSRIIQEGPERD
jgi:hypothetical protein